MLLPFNHSTMTPSAITTVIPNLSLRSSLIFHIPSWHSIFTCAVAPLNQVYMIMMALLRPTSMPLVHMTELGEFICFLYPSLPPWLHFILYFHDIFYCFCYMTALHFFPSLFQYCCLLYLLVHSIHSYSPHCTVLPAFPLLISPFMLPYLHRIVPLHLSLLSPTRSFIVSCSLS